MHHLIIVMYGEQMTAVNLEAKTVEESKMVMAYQTLPQDANPSGTVHGGIIMKFIDSAAGSAAIRHSRSNCVTTSMDRMEFYQPVYVGDMITIIASVNYVGNSSIEVGARVESENMLTGETRHTASAYITYVAVDDHGKPRQVPGLILATEDDQRRHRKAALRREKRKLYLAERKLEKETK